MRRYLSWIEGLTTNQYAEGSNPPRRTTETASRTPSGVRLFLFSAPLIPPQTEHVAPAILRRPPIKSDGMQAV
jgi:hypothetical protein